LFVVAVFGHGHIGIRIRRSLSCAADPPFGLVKTSLESQFKSARRGTSGGAHHCSINIKWLANANSHDAAFALPSYLWPSYLCLVAYGLVAYGLVAYGLVTYGLVTYAQW